MKLQPVKKLNEKTHTKTVLIYKTSPFPHWFIILIIALCFIGGIIFLFHNYSDLDIEAGFEILIWWVIGLFFIIEFNTTKWYFNKQNDLVIITKEYVVCRQSIITKYKLSEIEKIYWQKEKIWSDKFADIIDRYNYIVYIKFKTNIETFNVFPGEKEAKENVKKLENFLNTDEKD